MANLHHRHHQTKRSHSHQGHARAHTRETIKRGILIAFHPTSYTADVLIMEATSTYIQGIPVACHLDGTSAIINTCCVVLFFDEQNYSDAVVLAVYPNGAQGIPIPAPGRVVFVTAVQQVNNATISSGSTNTYALTGGSSGIPMGTLGVVFKANFSSPTANASIYIAPHGSVIANYIAIGNLPAANVSLQAAGLLPLDSNGQIDVKANNGNCTFNLFTYGYII